MASGTTDSAHGGHGHEAHPPWHAHHFDTPAQQFESAKFGMWVFICTEILMFGGLFVAYGLFKAAEPEVFHQAHLALDKKLGAANTIVLLFSSLTAALAVRSSQLGRKKETSLWLIITILCAAAFLVVKYFEYTHKLHDGLLPGNCFGYEWCRRVEGNPSANLVAHTMQTMPARGGMFFALYFMMTGLHALHILVGMSILVWVLLRNNRGDFSAEYFTPVEIGALYWHLVDLVWIYLFPLLYLVG